MHISTFSSNLRATSNILLCGVSITVWGLSCDTWSGWEDGGDFWQVMRVCLVSPVLCQPELKSSVPNIGYPLQYDIRRFYFNRNFNCYGLAQTGPSVIQRRTDFASRYSILHQDIRFCIKIFDFASRYSILHQDIRFCIKIFDFASRYSILHQDFPYLV